MLNENSTRSALPFDDIKCTQFRLVHRKHQSRNCALITNMVVLITIICLGDLAVIILFEGIYKRWMVNGWMAVSKQYYGFEKLLMTQESEVMFTAGYKWIDSNDLSSAVCWISRVDYLSKRFFSCDHLCKSTSMYVAHIFISFLYNFLIIFL